MSTFKGTDDCTDLILDFIAGGVPGNPSGESKGNYNALIGNAAAKVDLALYTLDGILHSVMPWLLSSGEPSTAVGRYQIIRATLVTLQSRKGLPSSALFTHQLQDELGLALMVGRGYRAWWRGALTDAEFAHGLSMEWASLPDPNAGGKSHYDGVGPNHAGTTLEHVYDMLKRARALIPQ